MLNDLKTCYNRSMQKESEQSNTDLANQLVYGIDKFEDLFGHIETQIKILENFCNDLLDLAKIDNGCFNIKMCKFSMHSLIDEVYRMFRIAADMQGTKLIYNLTSNFPKFVRGDKTRL